jgi:1-acyl-sn-glycerol-3-phosphate acyltransferase
MIPAEKNSWLEWALHPYLRFKLRRSFQSVLVRGLNYLQELPADRPVIAFSNHISWWDVPLVFFLSRCARNKSFYCMMDEAQVKGYPFAGYVGAFSIDLNNSLRAAGATRYAVHLLQIRSTLLWIFPQGEISATHQPFKPRPDSNYLATQANSAQMLPVAFRYEFFREGKPHVLIEIGQPFSAVESSEYRIAAQCTEVAKHLDDAIVSQNVEGFEVLVHQPLPFRKKWEWLKLAIRGRLDEFKAPSLQESLSTKKVA